MKLVEDDRRKPYDRVRELREANGCTCKVGPWERIENFDEACPWHTAQ